MALTIQATVASKIGFASHQNAVPIIREIVLSNSDTPLENLRLVLDADPAFLKPRTWPIDRLGEGDELRVSERDVALHAQMLGDLRESLSGAITLRLEAADGTELATFSQAVQLLARNEWGGGDSMVELLPAFIMPNDPAVDRVLKTASDILRRAGRPDALDGYASGKRERVWEITSAIWSAIAGFQLSYAVPPASFERTGQKIRTPSAILEGRVATCLDTTLLFAATLEQAGLNPLVVLTEGHAFAGVWLQPMEFATLVTDEAAALRRHLDLSDLVVFETTLATSASPAGFSQAMAAAQRQIAEGSKDRFDAVIDVHRARMQKIRPLGAPGITGHGEMSADKPVVLEGLEAAPFLPAFDVAVETLEETAGSRIEQWQRKLLDLTTRNRLLHLPEAAKAVRLLCPDPGKLEDLLASGKKVRIVPMPDLEIGGRDEDLYETRNRESLKEEVARTAMDRGEALSLLSKDKLDAALVELYRKARSDIEEGGANTLYLALGSLKWKKSATEQRVYRAPLILLPVKLERRSALSGVVMVHHEDEPRFNLTLLELLRQDFALNIPGLSGELPKDDNGIDVVGVWRVVRAAIRDIPGFEVVPEVVIATVSFAKYLMWKDLVDRAARLKESPLVRHLIEREDAPLDQTGEFPRPEDLDGKTDPAELFTPLPADSSQLAAVVASAEGRHFVLDGPPGTGKSQTIANIIAHNLGLGRRVLFVAEKKAALDVVQRRLEEKGLGPFCLELHSAKATKVAVLKQLDRAWTTRDALTEAEWRREAAEAKRLRDDLNDLVRVLHRRDLSGWTIHRAIGRAIRDTDAASLKLTFAPGALHGADDMSRFGDVARRLGIAWNAVADLPQDLKGVSQAEWSNGWQEAILAASARLPSAIDEFKASAAELLAATGLSIEADDREAIAALLTFVLLLLDMHGHDLRLAFEPDFVDRNASAGKAMALVSEYRKVEHELSAPYAPEAARRVPIEELRGQWVEAGKKKLFAGKARNKVALALQQAGGTAGAVDPGADLPRLARLRDLLVQLEAFEPRLAQVPGWSGLATEAIVLAQGFARADRLRKAIAAQAPDPGSLACLRKTVANLVVEANDLLDPNGAIARAAARLGRALNAFDTAMERFATLARVPERMDFDALRAQAAAIAAHAERLNAWTHWQRARGEAISLGLMPLVEAVESGAIAPTEAVRAFEAAYARWFAATRIDEEPILRHFMSGEHADRIRRYRELVDRHGELSVRYIRARLCGLIPSKAESGKLGGYGVLKHQLQLQRAHKPIRRLASEMGDAFTRLAPCMLMSPLSIAQYLPPDQALFDLVIFDEASQITPWDAIGAMARGKQVIVAGDPRQMPPTNFFLRGSSDNDGDDGTEADLESILDQCLAAGVPQHSLEWHYRSRHESLITFSNHAYYEGQLVTFPAPVTRASAVSWRKVDGVYAKGAGKTNPIEAQALVEEAVRRLRDPGFVDSKGKPLTLGIITLNSEQQNLVEDLLDRERRRHPEIEPAFSDECSEPVVVKNLETVQGDERDLILLGVGFGPTEPAGKTMSMNFGALNKQGGERRLNVAITRARSEMVVFTSFEPGMIDLTRTTARAVTDLKNFVAYAERGPRAIAEAVRGSLGGADSPFEEAVADELRRKGWTVVPQVGVSKFRIDLGVVHPDRPGDYLLGIECDGATYHSAATARDRDKVRAAILENLGWKLLRIWSTDWWIDRRGAADRIHRQIEEFLSADRTAAADRAATAAIADDRINAAEEAALPGPSVVQVDEAEPSPTLDTAEEAITLFPAANDDDVADDPSDTRPAQLIARAASLVTDGHYHVSTFAGFEAQILPQDFYEPTYDATLDLLIDHVLATEAPIAEPLLVQRIARAHGFQRAGRVIRDRVMKVARRKHHVTKEKGGDAFIWMDRQASLAWSVARFPATENDIRQIEFIALAELAAAEGDPVEIARNFGVRRLSASARARIEIAKGSVAPRILL
jgi:very-short-patch-repair endonuclease